MKRLLLATIHGFYLQAMGRLPTSELCDSYHRSMLMGGHCYGPLDPVSNIIVNTIWYEHNFPASKQFPVAMISTTMLSCIVARSLYGLVSFLCTRYRGLTPDLAMQRLLVTGVSLRAADPNLSPTPSAAIKKRLDFSGCTQVLDNPDTSHIQKSVVEESTPSASVDESYIAAATAGFHGYPLAQQEFLASPTGLLSKLELVSEVLHIQVCVPGSQSASDGQLSPQKLSLLRTILQRCPSSTGKLHQQERIDGCERAVVEVAVRRVAVVDVAEVGESMMPSRTVKNEVSHRVCQTPGQLGTNARAGVANTAWARQGTTMNHTPMSEETSREASETVAARERQGELPEQHAVVGEERSVVEEDMATLAMNHVGRSRRRCGGTNGLDGDEGGSPVELHFISGVNELVSGPVRSLGEKVGDYNPWTLCKARLYDPPTLFFAECGKDGADTCWCVPVIPQKPEAGQVRCIYCEYQGNRILHPAMESFHGRNEFENLFYGSDGSYTNDKLITNSDLEVDWVHGVQDGAIYRDCYPDSDDDEDDWIDIF
uniref:Thyroglobulin type-1 domain-containing protein n=1 Tax=Oryza meridionalis TaxID=40149 RepID=A0A0E0E8T8_9ORYZ